MSAAVTIGTGLKTYLFSVGELNMLHVEVRADSIHSAIRFISSGECLKDFPYPLSDELRGEEFRLIKES